MDQPDLAGEGNREAQIIIFLVVGNPGDPHNISFPERAAVQELAVVLVAAINIETQGWETQFLCHLPAEMHPRLDFTAIDPQLPAGRPFAGHTQQFAVL
jgi:hypothetical protein